MKGGDFMKKFVACAKHHAFYIYLCAAVAVLFLIV